VPKPCNVGKTWRGENLLQMNEEGLAFAKLYFCDEFRHGGANAKPLRLLFVMKIAYGRWGDMYVKS